MLSRRLLPVAGVICLSLSAQAVKFFTDDTVPVGLTSSCTTAFVADVDCDPVVPALQSGEYYPNTTLIRACTARCRSSLALFQTTIAAACGRETWEGYDDNPIGGQFCNNVAAAYAAHLDPDATGNDVPANGQYGSAVPDDCDLCLIKNLQFQAGSPYYDGPDLWSSSIYQSKTSSCQVSNLPLTSTPLTLYTPTSSVPAVPSCTGHTYNIKSGDDCHSVSLSQHISTSWLLQDNNLAANCADFPTTGNLCLINTCNVYTVKTNDTCDTVSRANNITVAQFKAWNPNINAGCYNIDFIVGDQVCVGKPGVPYVQPPSTTLAPSVPMTAAPVPTDVAQGTNMNCGQYYRVVKGDYCNLLVIKFGISLSDFVFLNPAINDNCTNLFADESYCVQAVGDINTYSGRPGHTSYTMTLTSLFGDPATRWPDVTYTTATSTTSQLPLASDTRPDCFAYFNSTSFIGKVQSGSMYLSDCDRAARIFMVSLEDLAVWNPSLGNTSLSTCTFKASQRYCAKYYIADSPPPPIPTDTGSPIRENTTTNCKRYLDVFDGSGYTCADILKDYAITIAQFFSWNPAVGPDCSSLWIGYQYCVEGPGSSTPTSTGTSTTSTTKGPGAPTQTGQPANCNKWYTAKSGDSCAIIESTFSITLAQFLRWNPTVSNDCSTGFLSGFAYCVGTTDTISSTRSSSTTTTTTTATPPIVAAPDPHQENNAVKNCNKFAQAKSGDYCFKFAQDNSINTDQLYAWNLLLGKDGSGCGNSFWAGYWYCVGVA